MTLFDGSANATFDGVLDANNSSSSSDTIVSISADNNSSTQTDLTWDWNGSLLTGSGVVREEKTLAARPGGDHLGDATLTFNFTVDTQTEYSLDGLWGFDNSSPGGDAITLSLSGASGVIASDSSVSNTGIASDSFSLTGTLGPGSYTFQISAVMEETINNQQLALAGWQLNSFALTSVTAVPEPHSAIAMSLAMLVFLRRRQR